MRKRIFIFLVIMLLIVSGCSPDDLGIDESTKSNIESINEIMDRVDIDNSEKESFLEEIQNTENKIEKQVENKKDVDVLGSIEVHYIDVGQGDSILIKQGNNSMLIDAGDNHYGQTVVDYLRKNEVDTLDYVIGTHAHSDHIGGLDDVINTFSVGKIIMPKVTHTTKTFEDVLIAIQSKGLKITTPNVGDEYKLGDAKFTILGPNQSSYSNLNNYSVITRLEFGDNSFIFTGDAESQAETEVVNGGFNLKSDVLSVGHHGSDTSTIESFLDKVEPSFAVISVGAGNRYGHPDSSVLNRLEERNIKTYRSDLDGTVIAKGNGEQVSFENSPVSKSENPSIVPKEPENSKDNIIYIGNKNSKIFHLESCSSLPGDKNKVTLSGREEATKTGYVPCKRCNP